MLFAAGIIALLIWLYLLLAHVQFWRIRTARLSDQQDAPSARIAVIIPARNEAVVVGRAVSSLLQQKCHDVHIFLIDDGSTDATAQAARDAATSLRRSDMLTVVEGTPLPSGWYDKLWAMLQGIE